MSGGQPGEPTQADIAAAYPDWKTWEGIDGLYHALRQTPGAALTAKGESWMDLLDQIRRAEVLLEDARPRGWPVPEPGPPPPAAV